MDPILLQKHADKTPIIVNGLPGKMATDVVKKVLSSVDFRLWQYGLTGPETKEVAIEIGGNSIFLYKPHEKARFREISGFIEQEFLTVDFSHPSAVNDNANYYCESGMNFVMGTTGGDRPALEQRVRDSNICAVIDVNMAPEIVSLRELKQNYANTHENQFRKYSLDIKESHQRGKADTSGTAKAMCESYKKMGFDIDMNLFEEVKRQLKEKNDDITIPLGSNVTFTAIRSLETQRKMGIPEEFLGRHGWHTYTITSPTDQFTEQMEELKEQYYRQFFLGNPALKNHYRSLNIDQTRSVSADGNIVLETNYDKSGKIRFTHNINGGSVYADGALDGLRFLRDKVRAGEKGKVYSMIDVLREQKKAMTLSE